MISEKHQKVAEHYELYPYPSYPWFAKGSWRSLESVDTETWGAERAIENIWVAGCGTIAPLMFGRRNYRSRILATDISKRSLFIAAKRLRLFGIRNVELVEEDLAHVSRIDCFDAVDAYGVIHHTVDPLDSLKRLLRSLRSGGVLRAMVYSKEARAEIETMRAQVHERHLENPEEIKKFLGGGSGDLSNSSGLADALLNPVVHTYDENSLDQLVQSVRDLAGLIRVDATSNYVVFLKRH